VRIVGLLGVLIVLVTVGALVYLALSCLAARRKIHKDAEAPWTAYDYERDGAWVVEARRPGHRSIVLASQPIVDGYLSTAVNQARSDAYENFLALAPRGEWDL